MVGAVAMALQDTDGGRIGYEHTVDRVP
jgi:hypothetical protein